MTCMTSGSGPAYQEYSSAAATSSYGTLRREPWRTRLREWQASVRARRDCSHSSRGVAQSGSISSYLGVLRQRLRLLFSFTKSDRSRRSSQLLSGHLKPERGIAPPHSDPKQAKILPSPFRVTLFRMNLRSSVKQILPCSS